MKKLDVEAIRATLLKTWAELPLPPESDDPRKQKQRRTVLMMKRAAPLSAELAVFGLSEMVYTNSAGEGLRRAYVNIGNVLGNNLINIALRMKDMNPEDPDGDEYAHAALHFMLDAFDQTMHSLFYDATGQKPHDGGGLDDHETIKITALDLPFKEVGDA